MLHKNEKRTERFNFRITVQENELIKAAAQLRQISASQYVAQSAAKQGEIDLAEQTVLELEDTQRSRSKTSSF